MQVWLNIKILTNVIHHTSRYENKENKQKTDHFN